METPETTIFCGIGCLVTMAPGVGAAADGQPPRLGAIRDGALLVKDGRIAGLGTRQALLAGHPGAAVVDLQAPLVIPGLVDCHTHLVWAGDRIADFEARCRGESYLEIAARGGGILRTVNATRAASEEQLLELALQRVGLFLAHGVTCLEVKSGYGLDLATELKILRVAARLRSLTGLSLKATFLGAHTFPAEYRARPEAYVELLINEMLPAVASAGLASFCDVFVEEGAFSLPQAERILLAARALGLGLKVHAEQLSHSGACRLAAKLHATSADHLDLADEEDAALLAAAGVVPVLLPTATLFLGKKTFPRAEIFRSAGLEPAVSTDYNPGSAMCPDLLLAGTVACVQCKMSPEEAMVAMTCSAARAMDVSDSGHLSVGARADFVVVNCPDWRELFYHLSVCPVKETYVLGKAVFRKQAECYLDDGRGKTEGGAQRVLGAPEAPGAAGKGA